MKVLDRKYYVKSERHVTNTWILHLDCGHSKLLRPSSGNYARAEIVRNVLCDICDKPKTRKLTSLKKLANYVVDNDL